MESVPNPAGSAAGPPEPRSRSLWSRSRLLLGLKKSFGASEPSPLTPSRTTESAKCPCGLLPGPLGGEEPVPAPLPVAMMIRPAPSETRPPPLIQTPPFCDFEPDSVDQSVSFRLLVFTPATWPT